MARIVLGIEYDGSRYAGWQTQRAQPTIQQTVERALSQVANHPLTVVCAGRTDTGVHALEQVAHFDTTARRPLHGWVMGGNTLLPPDVRIVWAREAIGDFHARYSAIARWYRYRILNRPVRSALQPTQLTWCYAPLDATRMHRAAQCLIGEHDFSSFRAQGCQSKSPCRHVYFIDVYREQDQVIIDICANAFVHHMVRNIAGALLAVGQGLQSEEWLAELLAVKDRTRAGITAPADGLYLGGICYPAAYGIPAHPLFQRLPADARRYGGDCESVAWELDQD